MPLTPPPRRHARAPHGTSPDTGTPAAAPANVGLHATILAVILFSCVAGCGVVGDPIAPEDIGIEAKIRERQRADEQRTTPPDERRIPRDEPTVTLPPLQPMGTP